MPGPHSHTEFTAMEHDSTVYDPQEKAESQPNLGDLRPDGNVNYGMAFESKPLDHSLPPAASSELLVRCVQCALKGIASTHLIMPR